jgi:hypothetical protein
MTQRKSKEETNQEKQRTLALQNKYGVRITTARQGREAFLSKDYVTALTKYNEYLGILAETKEINDIYNLSPAMFNTKTEVTELLLISHIYWEIGRICEMTPKLQPNYHKALAQFVKFTANQPYQVLNAEMLRKYIKKNANSSRQIEALNSAYSQIFVNSKKCYVATMCYGEDHLVTAQLRVFKGHLIKWPQGLKVVEIYYLYSSRICSFLEYNLFLKAIIVNFTKPFLSLFAKFTESGIFKRCSYYLKSLPKNGSNH